jgi:tetrahydromethanopterin S-methyltransferase subunit E
MSPAGSAILWDMLVSHIGQIVGAGDIVPEPFGWKILDVLEWLLNDVLSSSQRVPLLLTRSRWIDISQVLLS